MNLFKHFRTDLRSLQAIPIYMERSSQMGIARWQSVAFRTLVAVDLTASVPNITPAQSDGKDQQSLGCAKKCAAWVMTQMASAVLTVTAK